MSSEFLKKQENFRKINKSLANLLNFSAFCDNIYEKYFITEWFMKRASGVLMHISSLPSGYSIGSFGDAARRFIDIISDGGFSFWQVLPFCMPDEYGSPYKSYSAFGANPYFIDLPSLYEKGLISASELCAAREESPYLVEFDKLATERLALLRLAAMRIDDRSEINEFVDSRPELALAARFLALKERHGGAPWQEWGDGEPDVDTLFFWKFIQYEFFTEWKKIREYANGKGVYIIGDVPIYVSEDSADIWAHKEEFLLDSRGYPLAVSGVPPDYFSEDGQLWGNPLYDFSAMKKNDFSWWRSRIGYMLELFDGVRIDHFRAFESFWSVPCGAKSAKEGRWVKGPGIELVQTLKNEARGGLIIAEDLGDITPAVRDLLSESALPGMRVFQFAFLGDENTPHLPHNYSKNSVAYTGTHDNNTILGYVWELDPETRRRVFDYCGYSGENFDTGAANIVKTVLASHSDLAIIPIQDILGFGCDTRMNTPGEAKGNWQYRITGEQLASINAAELLYLNRLYGRK